MNEIERIRRRINKTTNNGFLFYANCFLGILIIILSSLIYMKKDPTGNFIKKVFNENVSFEKFNYEVSKIFSSLIIYKEDKLVEVASNVDYIELGDHYYYTNSTSVKSLNKGTVIFIGKEDDEVSLIIQYDNGVIASYFDIYDITCSSFDEISKNEALGTYIDKFRVLFRKGNELLTLRDAI